MWKSPIEIQIEAAQTELIKKEEQQILNMVQSVTFRVVDRQQLIDALNYDSRQYAIGYKDGLEEAKKQIIVAIKEDLKQIVAVIKGTFDTESWLNDITRTIEETELEPPDDCDYEVGYDPFLGCITDDC